MALAAAVVGVAAPATARVVAAPATTPATGAPGGWSWPAWLRPTCDPKSTRSQARCASIPGDPT